MNYRKHNITLLTFLLGFLFYVICRSYWAYCCTKSSKLNYAGKDNDYDEMAENAKKTHHPHSSQYVMQLFQIESSETLTENMSISESNDGYFKFVSRRHFNCSTHARFGKAGDGGWDLCLVEPYRPKSPCLVYSFGIGNDFSFDDAISRNYSCTVRSFDPSMTATKDHQRGNSSWFYKIGLGGKNSVSRKGWKLKTLQTIVHEMNDTGKLIDYLKLDIENSEWASLEEMYDTGILSTVKQLGMEIHMTKRNIKDTMAFYKRWKTLKRLEDFGFRRWYWHMNIEKPSVYKFTGRRRSCCYEMVYVNIRFLVWMPN